MNYILLKNELKNKKISIIMLSSILKISRSALYRKMYGKSDFTRNEIQTIISFLNLEKEKIELIFFSSKVS